MVSHSGNTEETLSCYQQALEKRACLVAMSTGGALIERAKNDNVTYAQVPAGRDTNVDGLPFARIVEIITTFLGD